MEHEGPADPRVNAARANVWHALLPAGIMLVYGFVYYSDVSGTSNSEIYNRAVTVFGATLKIGGVLMVAVTAACAIGMPAALLLDAIVSVGCGGTFAACGLIWLITVGDLQGILLLVFGIIFLASGWSSWNLYAIGGVADARDPAAEADEPPPHPASLPSDALPRPDETPPPDGYLAALSREKTDPPRAEHE